MCATITSAHAEEIAEAEKALHTAELKIIEIERLKKMEPSLRKEVEALTTKVEKLKSEKAFFGNEDSPQESPNQAPIKRTDLFKTKNEEEEDKRKLRLKLLSKKLRQIDELKKREGELDPNEQAKLAGERKVRAEIEALEKGEAYNADDEDSIVLPTDADEKDKMIKGLKKKLQQIESLKDNENLDADAKAKLATEHRLHQQLAALERGDLEVLIQPPPELELHEVIAGERKEVDKKLKAVNKKLDQIKKLKESNKPLSAEEKNKLATEADLKKQKKTLDFELADVDKKEQDRVFDKLGWQDETKGKKNKK